MQSKVRFTLKALVFSALILCTQQAKAQYYSDPTFFGGFIVGFNMAQVDGDNLAGYRCLGLNVGGIVHTELAENLTLSMEVNYSEKGSRAGLSEVPKITQNTQFTILSHDIRLQSAEVPVYLNIWTEKDVHFSVGFGYGRLVNAKELLNGIEQQEDFPFVKNEASMLAGVNVRLWKHLFLNTRFQYSLLNIRKLYNPNSGRPRQFSRVLSVRLAYLFGK